MFEANIKILSDLKDFISLVAADRDLLSHFCVRDQDFTRKRKLPFAKLALLITRLCKKTLSVELESFFEQLGCHMPCSVSAFSQHRLKLSPHLFQVWNTVLQRSFYHHYAHAVRRWKHYRLMAADGSSINLVNIPAFKHYFGGQSNQLGYFVQAKAFYHYDILNEVVVRAQIKPYRYSELQMAYDGVGDIQADMLTVYDRNFCNFKMVALHSWHERETKFVIRAKQNLNVVKAFINTGLSSQVVELKATALAIKGLRRSGFMLHKDSCLPVRLVRVELADCTEVLMTNLWEQEGHEPETFKDLYAMRWAVQTSICLQKNIGQLESFSGLSVQSVLQDFHASVLMTNLHAIIIKDAQKSVDDSTTPTKYPMKINKNKSFGRVKACLVCLFINNDVGAILSTLHARLIREVVPVRKGRRFKRMRKNVRTNGKHRTFTNFKPSY